MKFTKKGQGAMEYLLLIGATILVAITVIILIINMNQSNRDNVVEQDEALGSIFDNTLIPPVVTNVDCIYGGPVSVSIIKSGNYSGYKIKVGNADPYPTVDDLLQPNANGVLVLPSENRPRSLDLGMNLEGSRYNVSVIAVKNQLYSKPSAPAATCTLVSSP